MTLEDRLKEMQKRAEFNNLENPKTSGERDAMLLAVDCLWLIAQVRHEREKRVEERAAKITTERETACSQGWDYTLDMTKTPEEQARAEIEKEDTP